MMWWDNGRMGLLWWAMGAIWMALLWGGIVFLIVWVVRQLARSPREQSSPLDIARERYARGEITREQFEEIKRGLAT